MLIRGLDDWHFDGYIIHMIKNIKNIKYNKLEIFREKITKTLQWYQDDHSVDWIDLSSWATIFQSLKDNYNEICIWGATEEVDQFMIGVITKFDDRYLLINKLTIFGKITKSEYQIPINEITHISFGDEYSRILFEYAKKHK
jgi:hypothetical protein